MSIKLQHTLIRASAGSGKTYQLANRYIALLLLQAAARKAAPERLVAVTFTRKGAGEFAERILQRLAKAAQGGIECEKLRSDLDRLIQGDKEAGVSGLAPGVDLGMDAATVRQVLAVVVDEFDRLALGTIDSFMARSVQTLAFELGLDTFEILEEAAAERLQQELLGKVFTSAAARNLETFYQAIKQATLRSASGLRQELNAFVDNYHELFHSLPDAPAWGGAAFWNGQTPMAPGDGWRQQARELRAVVEKTALDSKLVRTGLTSSLEWLASREPGMTASTNEVPTWLGVKVDAGEEKRGQLLAIWPNWPKQWECYPRSNSAKPCIVPTEVMAPLRSILESWLAAECAALAKKTGAIYEIVEDYETLYETNARRKGRLAFADLPLLLKEEGDSETAQRAITTLAFRWFQQFDHWMLDEFQDTSRVQWSVLKPWLDEALQDDSGCKSVFVVGDAKQSIYGWRGGEPRLFEEFNRAYPGLFQEQVMAESWRSRPSVLELVNRICDPEKNPALKDSQKFSALALPRWRYDCHRPEKSRAGKPGYAAVLLTPEEQSGEDDESDGASNAADEPVEKLAAQARVIKSVLYKLEPLKQGLTCAILVRKNENAQAIAQWLRANEVPNVMVEGDATLADQSPLVAALVAALRWLNSPAHTLAGGHIQLTPLWEVLAKPVQSEKTCKDLAGAVWEHWRLRMSKFGAGQVTREWCAQLSEAIQDDYSQYCLRQVNQLAYRLGAALALPDWRLALERLTVRETAAAGSIHVMTVHKAKGLGFDVVFLPDLDLGGGFPDSMLLRRDSQGQPTGCLVCPPKSLRAWVTEFETLKAAREADQDLEALCVLYVALTRAKEATFVIVQKEKPRNASRARNWLLGGIGGMPEGAGSVSVPSPWGEGELLWQHGTCDLVSKKDREAESISAAEPFKLAMPIPRRERRKPSDAGHKLRLAQAATPAAPSAPDTRGQQFGTAVHEVFQQVEWWQPGQTLVGPPTAVETVRKCLEVPEIRALFTPETPQDEVCRELPFELIERNTWWSGIVDRLVLRRHLDGTLGQAVIIDFKTDTVASSEALRTRYSDQVAIYRSAIGLALTLSESQVKTVLVSTHLKCVVELKKRNLKSELNLPMTPTRP